MTRAASPLTEMTSDSGLTILAGVALKLLCAVDVRVMYGRKRALSIQRERELKLSQNGLQRDDDRRGGDRLGGL